MIYPRSGVDKGLLEGWGRETEQEASQWARGMPDGGLLSFTPGSERTRSDNFLLIRSSYRHLFGDFRSSLGGVELSEGFGVMEQHDAVW